MRLVDDDGERAARVSAADLVEYLRELLHGGDDDLLAALEHPAQVSGSVGVPDGGAHLCELLDRVADLLVEHTPVCDHDHRVEHGFLISAQGDELMAQPGDGVRLPAACGVLDQIASTRAVFSCVGQQLAHHLELVVARPDLLPG